MKGLPYFGDDTVAQLTSLQDREPKVINPQDLEGVTDLHTLFRHLLKNEYLFIIEHPSTQRLFATWCWDIRFNYRDREVFIPYYSYKTFLHKAIERDLTNPHLIITTLEDNKKYIAVRYFYTMNKLIIDNRKEGYKRQNICVYQPSTDTYLQIDIEKLPYLLHNVFSVSDLLNRHTNYKFQLSEFDVTSKDAYYTSINKKNNREKSIRSKEGFSTYSDDFMGINYQDIRTFVINPFSDEAQQMTSDEDYVTRVYDFESYLYCLFAQQAEPSDEHHKKLWVELGTKKRFITLGETYPLTLKYYYTDKPHTFKRLTYERFV